MPQQSGGAAAARRQREGARRLEKLSQFYLAQQMHGLSRRGAARFIRVSHLNLWRWEKKIRNGGLAGLVTRRKGPPCSPAVQLALHPQVIRRVQRLSVVKGSVAAGWRAFVTDSICPRAVRKLIAREIPDALREAVGFTQRTVLVRVTFSVRKAGAFTHRHQLGRKAT